MAIKKSVISIILIIALAFSVVGSTIIADATETGTIEDFVERMYTNVLNRTAEPVGMLHWSGLLRTGAMSGAAVAHNFFSSQEFINRNLRNDEFVDVLYNALMGRPADDEGKAMWVRLLGSGWSREDVFAQFVGSPEFDMICSQAGINRGTFTPAPGRDIRVFVTRLYNTALRRPPDDAGLNHWTNLLLSGAMTGAAVAYNFIFSAEMINEGLSDEVFVERLYLALMGRASDSAGKTFWVNHLRTGTSRFK